MSPEKSKNLGVCSTKRRRKRSGNTTEEYMSSKRSSSTKSRRSAKSSKRRSRRTSKRSDKEESASSKVEKEKNRPKRNESRPPRKMGRLMVFYTIEKDTPIGTVTKEIAMISMIKVWSDVVLIERDMIYIKIENICDIVKEGNRRFTIEYKDRTKTKSFQAHSEEKQEEWLKFLFRVWDDKKSEKRRLAQRAERERRILEGRLELTPADAEILHAAQENDLEKLKKLRRTCTNLDVCTHGTQSRTALHISVMRGHFECVKALLVPSYEKYQSALSKLKAPKWVANYNEFVAFRKCEHSVFPCSCGKRKQELLCKVADLSDWKTYVVFEREAREF